MVSKITVGQTLLGLVLAAYSTTTTCNLVSNTPKPPEEMIVDTRIQEAWKELHDVWPYKQSGKSKCSPPAVPKYESLEEVAVSCERLSQRSREYAALLAEGDVQEKISEYKETQKERSMKIILGTVGVALGIVLMLAGLSEYRKNKGEAQ